MRIETASIQHLGKWAALRAELWPEESIEEHRAELDNALAAPHRDRVAFVAIGGGGEVAGFAEASIRRDYVNGCGTSPVAFLEGMYVRPDHRHAGTARMLCEAVENWGSATGCTELGSDADIENEEGHAFHAAIGFEETERVIFYRKALTARKPALPVA